MMDYEHSEALVGAQKALVELRKQSRRLWWMSGGRGYDNMGRRELDHVRTKLDEADFWLAAASRALNAGGKRAVLAGFSAVQPEPEATVSRATGKDSDDVCGGS